MIEEMNEDMLHPHSFFCVKLWYNKTNMHEARWRHENRY